MKGIRNINFKYPNSPTAHIVSTKHRKSATKIGKDYRFEGGGFFFKLLAGILRGAALIIFPVWAFFWMRTRVKGRKNFKKLKKQGVVIISNHVHTLDAPVLGTAATCPRKVRIVMLKENIDIPVAGTIIRMLGGIPLADNYGGMKKFTATIDDLLTRKKPVLFYPETALWPYYCGLRPFSTGGFSFSLKNNVPILPAVYTFKINKKGKKTRLVLHVLPAIYPKGLTVNELCEKTKNKMLDKMQEFYSDNKNNKSGKEIKILFE